MNGLRKCEVYNGYKQEGEPVICFFHEFSIEATDGGSFPVAIVEEPTGRVRVVQADRIKFVSDGTCASQKIIGDKQCTKWGVFTDTNKICPCASFEVKK